MWGNFSLRRAVGVLSFIMLLQWKEKRTARESSEMYRLYIYLQLFYLGYGLCRVTKRQILQVVTVML